MNEAEKTEAEMFREKAEHCDSMARAAFTETARQELRQQAEQCRREAERLEALPPADRALPQA